MRPFFLALAALLVASPAAALPNTLRPIDQCSGDASFVKFRNILKQVVLRRDRQALLVLLAPDVLVDFGPGGSGPKAFAQQWSFDPHENGNVWAQLETMLNLGCARDGGSRIIPSLIMQIPDSDEDVSEPRLMLPGAKLYEKAGVEATRSEISPWTVATVTNKASDTMTGVRLPDGREGLVDDRRAYEPLGYRMSIERRQGRWMITAFVAGD